MVIFKNEFCQFDKRFSRYSCLSKREESCLDKRFSRFCRLSNAYEMQN